MRCRPEQPLREVANVRCGCEQPLDERASACCSPGAFWATVVLGERSTRSWSVEQPRSLPVL